MDFSRQPASTKITRFPVEERPILSNGSLLSEISWCGQITFLYNRIAFLLPGARLSKEESPFLRRKRLIVLENNSFTQKQPPSNENPGKTH
jgi:hypothetical protein